MLHPQTRCCAGLRYFSYLDVVDFPCSVFAHESVSRGNKFPVVEEKLHRYLCGASFKRQNAKLPTYRLTDRRLSPPCRFNKPVQVGRVHVLAGRLKVGLLVALGADRPKLGLDGIEKLEGLWFSNVSTLLKLEKRGQGAASQGEGNNRNAGAELHLELESAGTPGRESSWRR
jgi:hypothetical protein